MSGIEVFAKAGKWHCEPPSWSVANGVLSVVTGPETDFWQDTFYGFRRDDGHFLGIPVSDSCTAIVTFEGDYETLYDQAGMMLRADANTWLKTGIEFSDDITNFSVVVTREGRSDWSVVGVPRVSGPQQVRLTRLGGAIIVHYRGVDKHWHLLRLADFPSEAGCRIGPMTCSPQRSGFRARFLDFEIGAPLPKPLHAS
jgi:regulation of enolase protein 1 (concanavalin A-like superfamily)